jgi:cob(I)alamin adenosyltransferase
MNGRDPNTKFGKLDMELNRLSKILFVFMIMISASLVLLD